jgi:hypothetical protein
MPKNHTDLREDTVTARFPYSSVGVPCLFVSVLRSILRLQSAVVRAAVKGTRGVSIAHHYTDAA